MLRRIPRWRSLRTLTARFCNLNNPIKSEDQTPKWMKFFTGAKSIEIDLERSMTIYKDNPENLSRIIIKNYMEFTDIQLTQALENSSIRVKDLLFKEILARIYTNSFDASVKSLDNLVRFGDLFNVNYTPFRNYILLKMPLVFEEADPVQQCIFIGFMRNANYITEEALELFIKNCENEEFTEKLAKIKDFQLAMRISDVLFTIASVLKPDKAVIVENVARKLAEYILEGMKPGDTMFDYLRSLKPNLDASMLLFYLNSPSDIQDRYRERIIDMYIETLIYLRTEYLHQKGGLLTAYKYHYTKYIVELAQTCFTQKDILQFRQTLFLILNEKQDENMQFILKPNIPLLREYQIFHWSSIKQLIKWLDGETSVMRRRRIYNDPQYLSAVTTIMDFSFEKLVASESIMSEELYSKFRGIKDMILDYYMTPQAHETFKKEIDCLFSDLKIPMIKQDSENFNHEFYFYTHNFPSILMTNTILQHRSLYKKFVASIRILGKEQNKSDEVEVDPEEASDEFFDEEEDDHTLQDHIIDDRSAEEKLNEFAYETEKELESLNGKKWILNGMSIDHSIRRHLTKINVAIEFIRGVVSQAILNKS